MWKYRYSSELYHYGVKGMKWGIRRTPEQLGHARKSIEKSQKSNIIKEAIASGKVKKEINKEKQLRHSLHGHSKGRSYIYGDLDFAQSLVDRLSGTGEALLDYKGNWLRKEKVDDPHVIGVHIDSKTGKKTKTNKAMIVYSKTGTHIYPRKEEKNE